MADDLNFGATAFFGEPAIFPGGVSFGTIAFVDGQFQSRRPEEDSREYQRDVGRKATRSSTSAGTINPECASYDHEHVHVRRRGWRRHGHSSPASTGVLRKALPPGQTVTISGLPGSWQVSAITDDNPNDTFVNTVLHLTGAMLPTGSEPQDHHKHPTRPLPRPARSRWRPPPRAERSPVPASTSRPPALLSASLS